MGSRNATKNREKSITSASLMTNAKAGVYLSDYLFVASETGYRFCLPRYLFLVQETLLEVEARSNSRLRVIHPFGFEPLSSSGDFLAGPLRRFYFYIYSSTPNADPVLVEELFLARFRELCSQQDPSFANSIAVMAARTGRHELLRHRGYTWDRTDRLIVAEFRHSQLEPLRDYAHYLLGCVPGILQSLLVEMQRFELRSMARTRIFQIFLILHHVLGQTCLGLPRLDAVLEHRLRSHRSVPKFYYEPESLDPPTASELETLREVLHLLRGIDTALKFAEDEKRVEFDVTAFHGAVLLRYNLPEKIYAQFCSTLSEAYLAFWS